ncbi:DC-STAMP domain-containing protein 2 [Leptinotarsa decemlineata]|uniref:DC-STAMP domain-containing protein 2 n=1 Tax=Leptinotarsa decemlineata TaxID=7539 RepID=UPI003D307925
MSFVQLMFKASQLKRFKNELVEEKLDAIKIKNKEKRHFRFRHIGIKIRARLKRSIKRITYCFCCRKFCFKLRHDGSCENFVLKSFLGFIAGLVLTYIFFMFFVFQLNIKITTATVVCSLLGCVLMNGLAFSSKIRCIVLLTLPHFFSEKGRQALLAYALILVISGPAKNTLNNMGILNESLACGQEQLKSAVRQIIDVIKKPFYALRDAIKKVVETVKKVVKKIKEILLKIKRIIMGIIKVIKAVFQFLAKIISICNKELGTPFERCSRVFENAIADCNAKLGSLFSWMCSITYIVKSVCYIVKPFDLVCLIVDFINDSIIGVVVRKVKGFVRHIRTMFYVRIKFSHSFHFETNSSKSVVEISREIVQEIKDRTKTVTAVFHFLTSAAMLFFIFMIVRVTYYRYKFLTTNSFDNKFITKDFHEIDMRRVKLNKETVLPLNDREAKVYVKIGSSKLAEKEKKILKKAITKLAVINAKAAIYIGIDYALFWILNLIKYYGRFQSKVQAPNIPTPHISGNGLLADLLKSIVKAFQPLGIQLEIDTVPCLPTPIPPDYDRYVQIATLLVLCWVLTLLEPYGLRLRNVVMSYYHPTRAKQRSIWLYNHILRSRSSFLKFARRQLRRKVFGSKDIEKVTCMEFLAANFKLFALCYDKSQAACLLCGTVFRETDSVKPIRCQTPECPGIYCESCFADLRNLCTVCLSPIDYGDLSDLSEERDSSEEEPPKETVRKKRSWCKKRDKKVVERKISKHSAYEGILGKTETKSSWSFPKICTKAEKSCDDSDSHRSSPIQKQSKSVKSIPSADSKTSWSLFKTCSKTLKCNSEPLLEVEDIRKAKKKKYYEKPHEGPSSSEESENVGLLSGSEPIDSDYHTTTASTTDPEPSTDYSYSYQYDKDHQEIPPLVEIPFRDVEKQAGHDYAGMDSFREEDDEDFPLPDDEILKEIRPSIGTAISGTTFDKIKMERRVDFTGIEHADVHERKYKKKRKKKRHSRPLPESILCHCSDTDDEEGIHYLEETSLITLPKMIRTEDYYSENLGFCTCKHQEHSSSSEYLSSSSEISLMKNFTDWNSTESEISPNFSGECIELKRMRKREETKRDETMEIVRKPSRLKMLVKRVIPKFKVYREK